MKQRDGIQVVKGGCDGPVPASARRTSRIASQVRLLPVTPTYLALLLLAGCSTLPTDGWHREFDFRMQRAEWNYIQGPNAHQRMVNLCGDAPHLMGCAIRVKEGGQCVVFSIYSQEQAHFVKTRDGMSLSEHEGRHCGIFDGRNVSGAWGHK